MSLQGNVLCLLDWEHFPLPFPNRVESQDTLNFPEARKSAFTEYFLHPSYLQRRCKHMNHASHARQCTRRAEGEPLAVSRANIGNNVQLWQ